MKMRNVNVTVEKNLSEAWSTAEGAKPAGWEVYGVVRGPRAADPAIPDAQWVAWAQGPGDQPTIEGRGDSHVHALEALAIELHALPR